MQREARGKESVFGFLQRRREPRGKESVFAEKARVETRAEREGESRECFCRGGEARAETREGRKESHDNVFGFLQRMGGERERQSLLGFTV